MRRFKDIDFTQTRTIRRRVLQRVPLGRDIDAIVCGSIGRSGSSVLWETISRGLAKRRFGTENNKIAKLLRDVSWTPGETSFLQGVVYKTHDLPYALESMEKIRAVFVFTKASDVAISVYTCRERFGDDWIRKHFEHMKAAGSLEDMLERDVLRLGEQIDAWTNIEKVPTICIRYEALWDRGDDLSEFLGIPINLPNKRQRESGQIPANIRDKVHRLYKDLDERIEALPDVFIIGAG